MTCTVCGQDRLPANITDGVCPEDMAKAAEFAQSHRTVNVPAIHAAVAQVGEQLTRNQQVGRSSRPRRAIGRYRDVETVNTGDRL
jgi:hypothetical protein